MKNLSSSNIVRFYECLETERNYYIIIEFCDQGDLRSHLKKNIKLSEKETIKIMVDLLTGF